jgi:hypothetical protein
MDSNPAAGFGVARLLAAVGVPGRCSPAVTAAESSRRSGSSKVRNATP